MKMNSFSLQSGKKFKGEIYLLLMTVLWGGTFVIIKESLNSASPMIFVGIRFTTAFLILLPVLIFTKRTFNKKTLISGFALGLLTFFSFATQTVGLKFTSATKSAFLTGSCVVIIPFVQTIVEKRKPTTGAAIGALFVFGGVVFLSSGGSSFLNIFRELGGNFNIGDFFTLLCALFWAFQVVYLDIISQKFDYLLLVVAQVAVCAVMGFISAIILDASNIESFYIKINDNLILGILYTAIFATVITTTIQTKYQKEVTPTKAGIIYSFEPIFASVFAFFILNEKMSNFGLIGCVLIFSGLIISEIYDSLVKNGHFKSKSGNFS